MPTRWTCVASLVIVVAACRSGDKAPECEPTISGSIDRMVSAAKRSTTGGALARAETTAPELRQLLYASCVADSWSPEALRCFGAAGLPADLDACTAKLTHEQYVRVHKKIDPLLDSAPQPAPAVAVAPPPAPPPAVVETPPAPPQAPVIPAKPAVAAHRDPVRPRPPSTAKVDCSKVVLAPADAKCRQQYCDAHPDDLRCTAE